MAHAQRDKKLEAVVMKGVMDFANHGRDDHFKQFAARASAECLIAFLREQLDVEVVPGIDDLLVPGTEERLPENPPQLGRHDEAFAAAEEAFDMIWPFFKSLPLVFMQDTGVMIMGLLQNYKFLQRSPPSVFQERVEEYKRFVGRHGQ